jgi:hypothetical protein
MTRDEIVAANPIVEFVRSRGHELKPAGRNFITSACPVASHKKPGHRPVTIDVAKQIWHCNDCDVLGSVIDWLMHEKNVTADEAMRELGGGRNDEKPRAASTSTEQAKKISPAKFDWPKCVAAMSDKHIEHIAEWRGYPPEFVRELRDKAFIGIHNGLVAFPVENGGNVVGAHVRKKDGNWFYTPSGIHAAPFVFGEPGERPMCFESTWDGLTYIEKSGDWDDIIITRGNGNWKFATNLAPEKCTLMLWTQNDDPGDKWERNIVENTKCAVKRVRIPAAHKDLNDWTRNSGTVDALIDAIAKAETLREGMDELPEAIPLITLAERPPDPANTLLGNRYLCRDGIMFFVGPSGVGKSSVSGQMQISFALGRPAFHIRPARPSRILCIQAENDEGDLFEIGSGICEGLKLTEEEREIARQNVIYVSDTSHTGVEFLLMAKRLLQKHGPFDILWIDTFHAYLGGDILDVEVTSKFLRAGLNAILKRFHCAAIINHHTPKPTGQDKSNWRPSDWMYFGAGNADLTNAPRATMSMDSTHAPGVFEFRAGKRGKRLGWVDENGEPISVRYFCWEKGATIFWRDATDEDIERVQSLKPQRRVRSVLSSGTIEDLFELIPIQSSVEKNVLIQNAAEESRGDKRIGRNKARAYLTALIDAGRAFEWRIKRPKTNPRIEIARYKQPPDEPPD